MSLLMHRNQSPYWLGWITCAGLLLIACSPLAGTTVPKSVAKAPPPPTGPLMAEAFDPNYIESDCSYHGVTCASDGMIYFTLSSHTIGNWARVYRFDPTTQQVSLFWTPQTTTPSPGQVVQSKIHSPLFEYNGELFLATHTGHYKASLVDPVTGNELKPYPGGYVYAVDMKTGKGRVVAAPLHNRPSVVPMGDQHVRIDGEALISSIMDNRRGLFYAISWPNAIFIKVDVATGKVQEYGKIQDGAEAVPQTLTSDDVKEPNPHYQRCLRTLGIDDEGNVYGSAGDGSIWKYDREADRIVTMKSRMSNATAMPQKELARRPSYLNMWRTIVWQPTEKVFYGVHWASGWLFRFDPYADRIEPMMQWAPLNKEAKDYAQLGLAVGPNDTLYGLVHAEPLKDNVQRSVHLIALNLRDRLFTDYGNVLTTAGMTLMFVESCAVAPGGDIYTVGWTEIPPDRVAQIREQRAAGGVPEVRYPFEMQLLRIPAQRAGRSSN